MFSTDITYRDYAYLKKLGNSYKLIKCNEVRRKGYENLEVSTEHDSLVRRRGTKFEVFESSKLVVKDEKVLRMLTKENIAVQSPFDSLTAEEYNRIRHKGFEHIKKPLEYSQLKEKTADEKLSNNICRARNKILEYVLCNDFVFFVTLTLNPDKYDRNNLKQFNHDLSIFIRDYNKRKNADIKYLFIPEQHTDGCWHMHGFIMGLPCDRLELFDIHGDKPLPRYIVDKIKQGSLLYNFPAYEKKFGYNIFEPIRNKKASVLYMSKYLTKDLSRNVTELGNHLYYCSKGLKKAEIIKEGQFLDSSFEFDFSNEYGGQSFYDFLSDEHLEEIKEKIGGAPLVLDDYINGYRKKDGWYEFHDADTGEIFTSDYPEIFKEMG